MDTCQDVLAYDPDNKLVLFFLSSALTKQSRFDEALSILEHGKSLLTAGTDDDKLLFQFLHLAVSDMSALMLSSAQ